MTPQRRIPRSWLALGFLLAVSPCVAMEKPAAGSTPDAAPDATRRWEISADFNQYFLPDDVDYLQPTVRADGKAVHLEGRYNYEDMETVSIFMGWNYETGEKVTFAITPMAGIVFGSTEGLAPGVEATLTWKRFEAYTEFEYVFDSKETDESFMYNWSEISYAPIDWFRFGVTTQRTRVYQTERDIQRALLLGFTAGKVSVTGHFFNPNADDRFYVLSVSMEF